MTWPGWCCRPGALPPELAAGPCLEVWGQHEEDETLDGTPESAAVARAIAARRR